MCLLVKKWMKSVGKKGGQHADGIGRRHAGEGGIVHLCRLVAAVGNGAEDGKGGTVDVADMTDGAALHLTGDGAEGVADASLLLGGADDSVAGGDGAALDCQPAGVSTCGECLTKGRVGGDVDDVDARQQSHRIAQRRGVHVVLDHITGDGDVACRAGVECHKGDAEGGMQPPTLMFQMRGVDVQRLRDAITGDPDEYDMDIMPHEHFREGKFITVGLRNCIRKAQEKGIEIPVARTILITGMMDDEIWVNMSRVNGVDSTKPESYTYGEMTARKQIYEIQRYLKEFVPGFEEAYMAQVADFMGIRESRVIVGKYVLTDDDIVACRRFDDTIAVASYPVDIHHAKGGDCTLYYCDDCYDIPYRCLLPEKVEGLLVAGRCSSMSHEAMASTRVMSTCMALGEAAGRAARHAVKAGVLPSQIDVEALRAELRDAGAYLG